MPQTCMNVSRNPFSPHTCIFLPHSRFYGCPRHGPCLRKQDRHKTAPQIVSTRLAARDHQIEVLSQPHIQGPVEDLSGIIWLRASLDLV